MENKHLSGGYFPSNVNSDIVEEFLGRCYQDNGTTHGAYTKELLWIIEKQIDVFEGKLEVVEVMDQRASALFAHMKKESKTNFLTNKTNFFRKNKRSGSTRVYINNCPIKWLNRVRHFLIDHFNSKYGSSSYLTEQSMKLHIKLKNGLVKLVETKKEVDTSFISDEGGQISSMNSNNINELVEWMDNRIKQLEQRLEMKIESTVQSASNVSSKVGRKVKNVVNGKGKSGKAKAKLDKAERILNNLMKRYEHTCTNKQYREPLAKFTKQGDDRTVRSDLKTLEGAGLIRKVRSGAHGEETYEFTNNDLYHLYNNDSGKTRFFDDVKEKFFMDDAFTVEDLNEFIFEKYELFDARSQNKCLDWLIDDGLVKRHEVNPQLLEIQK